ncbi:hypothetical protein KCP69_10295 [Salmonella enterica subsp. enterica]|nr:hypothetical protein KCP69_10295 [Salmonella enterica subsp. enterica]
MPAALIARGGVSQFNVRVRFSSAAMLPARRLKHQHTLSLLQPAFQQVDGRDDRNAGRQYRGSTISAMRSSMFRCSQFLEIRYRPRCPSPHIPTTLDTRASVHFFQNAFHHTQTSRAESAQR